MGTRSLMKTRLRAHTAHRDNMVHYLASAIDVLGYPDGNGALQTMSAGDLGDDAATGDGSALQLE